MKDMADNVDGDQTQTVTWRDVLDVHTVDPMDMHSNQTQQKAEIIHQTVPPYVVWIQFPCAVQQIQH